MADPTAAQVSAADVRHVAKLARLAIPEERIDALGAQLSAILGYVNQLSAVDVTDVAPMAHAAPLTNVFREDVVEPSLGVEAVLANAPDRDPPYFKVPKVIGGDEDSAG